MSIMAGVGYRKERELMTHEVYEETNEVATAAGDIGLMDPHHTRPTFWPNGVPSRSIGNMGKEGVCHLGQELEDIEGQHLWVKQQALSVLLKDLKGQTKNETAKLVAKYWNKVRKFMLYQKAEFIHRAKPKLMSWFTTSSNATLAELADMPEVKKMIRVDLVPGKRVTSQDLEDSVQACINRCKISMYEFTMKELKKAGVWERLKKQLEPQWKRLDKQIRKDNKVRKAKKKTAAAAAKKSCGN